MNPYPLSEFGPLSLKFLLWMFLYWPLGFIYMYIMCCGVVRLAMFAQCIFTYYWSLKGKSSPVDLVVSTHIFYLVWLPCHQLFLTMMFRQNVKQLKIHALVKKWSNKDLTLMNVIVGMGRRMYGASDGAASIPIYLSLSRIASFAGSAARKCNQKWKW